MTEEIFESKEPSNQAFGLSLNKKEFEQIIKAIILGKYSWACVLILYFAGYNPLEYIPYRTYIRLLKNNCLLNKTDPQQISDENLKAFGIESTWIRHGSSKYSSS